MFIDSHLLISYLLSKSSLWADSLMSEPPEYFIFWQVFFFLISHFSLLVYRNTIECCVFIICLTSLLNPHKSIKSFFLYLWDKIPDKWLKYYPKAEGLDSVGSCSDGIDNDYDGLIDSADEGCATHVDKWSVDNCLSTSLFHNARSTSKYAT